MRANRKPEQKKRPGKSVREKTNSSTADLKLTSSAGEENYRMLIEQMSDGLFIADSEGHFVDVNPAGCRLLGYTCEEILRKTVRDLTKISVDQPLWLDELRSGQAVLSEQEMIRKDGTLVPVEISAKWLSDGRLQGIVRDITERKRTEKALFESEERLRFALEGANDGIWDVQMETGAVYMSPRGCEILGYQPAEMAEVARVWSELVYPDDLPITQERLTAYLEGQAPIFEVEQRLKTKSGNWKWVLTRGKAIERDSSGRPIRMTGTHTDITTRKRAKEQIQRRIEQLKALRAIDLAISTNVDLRFTLQVVLDQVLSELQVDAAVILLRNVHLNELAFAAGRGLQSNALQYTRLRLGEGYAGQAALEQRIISVPDFSQNSNGLNRSPLLASERFVSYFAVPLIANGEVKGVLELFHRKPMVSTEEWLEFLKMLATQAAIAIDKAELFTELQRANVELALAYDATLEGWSRALDLRDKETEGHTQRVTKEAVKLARAMQISEEELVHVRRGALLHDIGKMGIPDRILFKPDDLDAAEWEVMRKHPVFAYELLAPIPHLRPALDIPYCHHEKWNGAGYPRGLKGEQIPLAARVFAVVDVWDALRSDRPYRTAWKSARVVEYIRSEAGRHFDPQVVNTFLKLVMTEESD